MGRGQTELIVGFPNNKEGQKLFIKEEQEYNNLLV